LCNVICGWPLLAKTLLVQSVQCSPQNYIGLFWHYLAYIILCVCLHHTCLSFSLYTKKYDKHWHDRKKLKNFWIFITEKYSLFFRVKLQKDLIFRLKKNTSMQDMKNVFKCSFLTQCYKNDKIKEASEKVVW
jgi:hypothetical protein